MILLSLPALAQAAQPAAGNTVETAVTLPGVQHEADGVGAEYIYIRAHFPNCKPGTQALLGANGRRYDSIELAGPNCNGQTVFFDITDWFGK